MMSVDVHSLRHEVPEGRPELQVIVNDAATQAPPREALDSVAEALAIAEAELLATVTALTERIAAASGPPPAGDAGGDVAHQRRRAAALRAVIDGTTMSAESIARAAITAGIDLDAPCGVLAFTALASENSVNPLALRLDLAGRLLERNEPTVMPLALEGNDLPHAAFIVRRPAQQVSAAQSIARMHRLCVIVTEERTGAAGLRHCVRAASTLVTLAHNDGMEAGIVREKERLLDVLLGSVTRDAGDHFVQSVLGPVLALSPSRSEPLLETLGELLAARGGFAAAAQRLRVHRETVKYRMGRLTELTGYSIADPVQRTHLDVALRLGRFSQR